MRVVRLGLLLSFCIMTVIWPVGCEGMGWKKLPPEQPPSQAIDQGPVLADSIGALTYMADITGRPVRGFGVVINLGDTGSADCPTFIREHLIDAMTKVRDTWISLEDRRRFSPGELIDAADTAVVEVNGLVPPGAPDNTSFDLLVRAIPGTSTRSLAGGLLLPCELRLSSMNVSDEALLGGHIVARAAGPIFVNPFTDSDTNSSSADPRQGYVLSGGEIAEPRTLRLLLREPSYPMARRLERRINERFGQRPPIATAMSRGYLTIKTPPEYTTNSEDFIRLLPHLYIENHPAFTEPRLRELTRLITLPGVNYEHISLALQGIGRVAVPQIQPLYSHGNPLVRYYAARAGLRLQDVTALPVLADIAVSSNHGIALMAVHELGRCPYPQAVLKLQPLLDSPDQEIRIASYTALLHQRPTAISSVPFRHTIDPMQLNLILDVVDSDGPPLIYVRRKQIPRITVFGLKLPVRLPLFYTDAADTFTLNAVDETGDITMFAKRRGQLSEPILVAPRVAELISALADRPIKDEAGRVRGLGLSYSQVVQVLATFCRDGTIPAHLEVERTSMTELLGPESLPERPEAEESDILDEP